jgi:sulfur carrier protein
MITVRINGELVELAPGTMLSTVVEERCGAPGREGVAVALNGEVVRRQEWNRPVRNGDELEIVRATQGG